MEVEALIKVEISDTKVCTSCLGGCFMVLCVGAVYESILLVCLSVYNESRANRCSMIAAWLVFSCNSQPLA